MNSTKIQISGEKYLSKSVTFANIVDNWKQKTKKSKLASSTVRTYKNIIDSKLMPVLGKYNISDISKQVCENLINNYRKQSLSEIYLQMIWRVLSLIMKNAYEENLISQKFNLPFPVKNNEKINYVPQISQLKLENAIHKNDASVLMSVLLHEKILIMKLLALRKIDVNENDCSLTLKRKAFISGNSFYFKDEPEVQTVKISNESLRIILCEISKHNALAKKFPDSYNNPDALIFANEIGQPYKPSYYISKFNELSINAGINVTPKFLTDFDYTPQSFSKYTVKTVASNGRKYSYLKTSVKTNFGKREILATSVDALNEKIQKSSNRYSFRVTKNLTPFFDFCINELESSKHFTDLEKENFRELLNKYIKSFSSDFTINQIDDDFRLALVNYLNARKCPFNIREKIVGFLRDVCYSAMEKNFIRYNPFINVQLQADKPIKYHSLNEDEIQKILKLDSNDINNAFLQIKLLTGMRTSETLGLCWSDVFSDEGRIFVRNQIRGDNETVLIHTTKNYKPRKILPPSLTFEILEKVRAITADNKENKLNLVFCNPDGSPLKPAPIRELLREVIGREKARLHDLRVTNLTVIYKQTKNLALASKEAGHQDTDVTSKHYVDVKPDLNAAKNAFDRYYSMMFRREGKII